MLYALLFFLLLSFVLCFYVELKYHSPSVIFWVALTGLFLIPHLVYCLYLHVIKNDVLIRSTIFVSSFNYAYFFSKIVLINVLKKKKHSWIFNDLKNSKNDRVNLLLANIYLIGLFIWIAGLVLAGFNPFSSSWNDTLKVSSLLSQVGNILIFSASGIVLYSYLTGNSRVMVLGALLSLAVILLLRARILLITLVVPFVLIVLYRNNRINLKFKFVFLILVFTFLIFFLQAFRWSGGLTDFSFKKIPDYISTSFHNMTGKSGEFHLVTEFYKIVEMDNKTENFGEGRTYWRLALFWLPSSVLPQQLKFIKPRDFAIDIYNMVYNNPNNTRGTTHPTFYGDLFANFGWFGIAMSLFWVVVTEFFDQIFKRSKARFVFLLGNIATFYIMIARGAIYNGSFILIISLIIVSVMFYKYRLGKTIIF